MSVSATQPSQRRAQTAVIIGAGMPGLTTAWFLQERGFDVTVIDRSGVAAGSSWGNAGWVSPALTLPLNEPRVLTAGVRALVKPASPVYVPPTASPRLLSFLARFALNCTPRRWERALALYVSANKEAVGAYEHLVAGGVAEPIRPAEPFILGFSRERDLHVTLEEFDTVRSRGGEVSVQRLSGAEARRREASLGHGVSDALVLDGQFFIDPGSFVRSVAEAVRKRGGKILAGATAERLRQMAPAGVEVSLAGRERLYADVAVIATGATLSQHARQFGVKTLVQAGRGYSFSVDIDHIPDGPVYFPAQRVACTPINGRLRVAGMMEFRRPDAPLDPRRIDAIVAAAEPMLTGVDWEDRHDEWVGSRPCTPDGLPLIGGTNAPDVFVNGGHGMWGIALGPLSGRMLADRIATGNDSPVIRGFDPLR